MLATPGLQPSGDQWLHEVKWDGMRVLADRTPAGLRLFARSGRDVTDTFPELDELAAALPDGLLDGEIIALRDGVPSFAALADRMHVPDRRLALALAGHQPVIVMVFDVLRLYGVDLTGRPLLERRASLDQLPLPAPHWQVSPVYTDGPALQAATREQGLEGVVAKRRTSVYQAGRRSSDWIKTPNRHHQSCVVGGWRPETGSPDRIGALLIGVPAADGSLAFVGRVGSGITHQVGMQLHRLLTAAARPDSPFATAVPALDAAGAHWCDPRVVVEVRHLHWTAAGRLRQPVFRGIRTDLDPGEVRREP